MTIPDEALQAAFEAYGDRYRSITAMQDALTAALPFLQGVSSQRAQALEESDLLKRAALIIEGRSTAVNSEFIESLSNRKAWEVAEIIADHDIKLGAEIRALSSQPVADGWLPIETAPNDGTVIQVWHQVHKCPVSVLWKDDGFPYRGERLNWYERSYTTAWPESAFTHWRPLPASPEVSG